MTQKSNTERQNIYALFEKDPIQAKLKLIRSDLLIALVQKLRLDARPPYRIARELKIKTTDLKSLLAGQSVVFSLEDLLRLCMRAKMQVAVGMQASAKDLMDVSIRVQAQ